jgi:stage V sporulation protein R
VELETKEVVPTPRTQALPAIPKMSSPPTEAQKPREIKWQRVRYTMKDRKLSKKVI